MPSTDTPAVENLNDVRRALRDELIRLGTALDLADDRETAWDTAAALNTAAYAYVALGGDLDVGPTDLQRELAEERDQAVIQARELAEAIDGVVAAASELGGSYFEGDAFADFRAAFDRLANVNRRPPPIRVHGR